MSQRKLKLFRDGQFLGWRRRSTIDALSARGLVTLERNAKGYVVAAHEQHLAEAERKVENLSHAEKAVRLGGGTYYSFQDGEIETRPWDLKRLDCKRHGTRYAPAEVRPIFWRVVLDCLV